MADPRKQPLAEHDVMRWSLQVPGVRSNPVPPEDPSQLRPMVCLHVLVRAPTEWLVGSDHRARAVHDVLDRCLNPDVGGPDSLQPRSSMSRTRRPSSSTSWRADTEICRASGTSSSASTNVISRATSATLPSFQLEPDAPYVPLSNWLAVPPVGLSSGGPGCSRYRLLGGRIALE